MDYSSRNFPEWAREIYGHSLPGAMPDFNTATTPSMLPRPSTELMLSLQVKEAILASKRNQDQSLAATSSPSGHPTQVVRQTSHESPSVPNKQMPVAWANIAHIAKRSQGEVSAADGRALISNSYPTESNHITTPLTDNNSHGVDSYYSRTSESHPMDQGYIADDYDSDILSTVSRTSQSYPVDPGYVADGEDSDISYVASDSESESDSKASRTRTTNTIYKEDSWVRLKNLSWILEQLEEQVNNKIQKSQGSIRSDCFPAIYQSLDEEQKRRIFFWRFGPASYKKRYLQSNYMRNLSSKLSD